jgi:hypothetical protein
MNGGAKTCWRDVEARLVDGDARVPRTRWLAALHRLQHGEALSGLRLVDPTSKAAVTDPAEVDWTGFPVLEALEAVARDEIRLLRTLLDEGTHPSAPAVREDGFTPPGGLVWGLDLRRATTSEL